jgi:hypothetical protein
VRIHRQIDGEPLVFGKTAGGYINVTLPQILPRQDIREVSKANGERNSVRLSQAANGDYADAEQLGNFGRFSKVLYLHTSI